MVRLLTHEQVQSLVSMGDAIECMEGAFREEGEGTTLLPPRINMKAGRGWLRVGARGAGEIRLDGFQGDEPRAGRGSPVPGSPV